MEDARPSRDPYAGPMRKLLLPLLALSVLAASGRPAASQSTTAPGWSALNAVRPGVHIHVSADNGGKTCYMIAVDDDSLTCGRKDGSLNGRRIFPRSEVKSVKLTRYGVSTLGGLGIGLGAGALIGIAVFRPTPTAFLGNLGSNIGRAFSITLGGLAGPVIGGTTDMFRGPVIYRR